MCMPDITDLPRRRDVQMAKLAVHWDDEADNDLIQLWPANNDPTKFSGTREQLSEVRRAMKRYEDLEAEMMEDEAYYQARFRLQHTEIEEPEEEQ